MPPRKTAASGGTSSRTKKSAGLAQPTLRFQSARSSSNTAKSGKPSTPSLSEIEATEKASREPSPEFIKPEPKAKTKPVGITQGENGEGTKKKRKLDVKSKEWKGMIRDAKVQMGGLEPIHAGPDTHNDIHHVLRVFDLTSSYGPCVGITRLQRWERAKKWGLNPPDEIKDILTTQEGEDDVRYRENVLYGWV
ncbi:hypothetical protein I302_101734 [Kwoniella bestiolae CBS 10118]|uniref:DNA polymerase delta subunit 4 n=1 Tax=Kwoniella bestiolae CBS 10118 TaxID=1296100 RepID=A0A1B9GD25_9TREE|nr:hypothetical protein I302_00410 [Kwoniella bestiolae CBS 10118]OCF28920.1 hypothetical protein I302_00410 [Kwoniella bestiolae CBS 10118]